jgi:hypothetical protein
MVHSVGGNFLQLDSLYEKNIIEWLNFLSYEKDKQNWIQESNNGNQ